MLPTMLVSLLVLGLFTPQFSADRYLFDGRQQFQPTPYINLTTGIEYFKGSYSYSWPLQAVEGNYSYITYTYPAGVSHTSDDVLEIGKNGAQGTPEGGEDASSALWKGVAIGGCVVLGLTIVIAVVLIIIWKRRQPDAGNGNAPGSNSSSTQPMDQVYENTEHPHIYQNMRIDDAL
nr:hypothetical protein BaRGS_000979 [Batillaria attramentaria]